MIILSRKVKSIACCGAFVMLAIMAGVVLFGAQTQDVVAGGESGPAQGPQGGSCAPDDVAQWNDTCYGATWRIYDVESDDFETSGSSNAPGAHILGCKSAGATKYYILALEVYNPQTQQSLGFQKGAVPVNQVKFSGQSGSYIPFKVVNNSLPWNEVANNFNTAREREGIQFPTEWNETSWFCWNPDWGGDGGGSDPSDGKDRFWGHTKVSIDAQGDVPKIESAWVGTGEPTGGTAGIYVSTDTSSVSVRFTHQVWPSDTLYQTDAHPDWHFMEDICAGWNVENLLGEEIKKDVVCAGKSGNNTATFSDEVNVTLSPGETKMVCESLYHTKTRVNLKFTSIEKNDTCAEYKDSCTSAIFDGLPSPDIIKPEAILAVATTRPEDETTGGDVPSTDQPSLPICTNDDCVRWNRVHDYYEVTVESASDDYVLSSMACATITRPETPTGSSGSSNGDVMFAGETASINWKGEAKSYDVRKAVKYEAISYLVPASVNYSSGITSGNMHTASAPCTHFKSKSAVTWCGVIGGHSATVSSEANKVSYTMAESIAVPDYIGYKYCNASGIQWKRYYSISYDGGDNWTEHGTDWTVFDAACRTIAKKPSVAFWNGGVSTAGDIKTSLSPRFSYIDSTAQLLTASSASGKTTYGSWAEYLVAACGSVTGFASGSTLARGNSSTEPANLSPMTISNTDANQLGYSEIPSNDTLLTRLDSYLKSRATSTSVDDINALGTDVSETRIFNITGELNINNNIEVRSGLYSRISDIPQVIIFVDGDINIASNVTRIDAWLIATGALNTCAGFSTGDGNTDTQTQAGDGTSTRTYCDKQLVFNGPVIVGSANLRRTYGSDSVNQGGKYIPAEIFNLSSESYLWSYAQATRRDLNYTESYVRELAPRY